MTDLDKLERARAIIARVPFGRVQDAIIQALLDRFGTWVRTETLIECAWADDPNGGPLNANDNLRVHIDRIRKKIAPCGLAITGRNYGGRMLHFMKDKPL